MKKLRTYAIKDTAMIKLAHEAAEAQILRQTSHIEHVSDNPTGIAAILPQSWTGLNGHDVVQHSPLTGKLAASLEKHILNNLIDKSAEGYLPFRNYVKQVRAQIRRDINDYGAINRIAMNRNSDRLSNIRRAMSIVSDVEFYSGLGSHVLLPISALLLPGLALPLAMSAASATLDRLEKWQSDEEVDCILIEVTKLTVDTARDRYFDKIKQKYEEILMDKTRRLKNLAEISKIRINIISNYSDIDIKNKIISSLGHEVLNAEKIRKIASSDFSTIKIATGVFKLAFTGNDIYEGVTDVLKTYKMQQENR